MAKEGKVDKKDKKRKEVEPDVEDVEMGDVALEVRVLHVQRVRAALMTVFNLVPIQEVQERKGGGYCSSRRSLPYCASVSAEETGEEASQDNQEGCVLTVVYR